MRLFHLLALYIFACCATVSAQIPAKRYSPDFASSDPYGLANADLDQFNSPGYLYSKWGVLMSEAVQVESPSLPFVFTFTKLTAGPFSSANTELFTLDGSTGSLVTLVPQFSGAGWFGTPGSSDGSVSFAQANLPSANAILMRKYHFPSSLTDEFGGSLGISTKKVVILIHGWNTASDPNAYDDPNKPDWDKGFYDLKTQLHDTLAGSDWPLVLYRWEKDADTGFLFDGPSLVDGAVNGTEAAEYGHHHGQHLGQLLNELTTGKIEKVHFIAHSAGSWVARAAAKFLLAARQAPGAVPITIQVTLLDPFIPGAVKDEAGLAGLVFDSGQTALTKSQMRDIYSFPGATAASLYRLENYYSADRDNILGGVAGRGGTYGTQERFGWRAGIDLDQRLDDIDPAYDSHFEPILFYAQTILDSQLFVPLPSVSRFNVRTNDLGWYRSMFMQEPIVSGIEVSGGQENQIASLTASVNTRREEVRNQQDSAFKTYRWQKLAANNSWVDVSDPADYRIVGATFSFLQFNQLLPSDAGWYRLRVTRTVVGPNKLSNVSAPVQLIVTGSTTTPTAPAAPSDLTAPSVTSSQVNLAWRDNSNNETGFSIEQRNPDGSWPTAAVKSASANATSASISGLAANTSYTFRVRAKNGALVSGPSNEKTITTSPPADTNFTLNITSSSPASGVSVASMLDTGGYVSATTPTSRSFAAGAVVTVTCPRTLVSGKIFQKWLLDGVDHDFDDVATVTMNAAHTVTAVYGTSAPPARTLTSLAIEGASSVDENDSETYKARASYSDGTTALVSGVDWEEDSSYADISSGGVLDAEAVSSDKSVTVTASSTAGSVTRTATKAVTIRNTASTQTYTLTRNVVGGGSIGYSPQATNYAAGTVVSLHGNEDGGWLFSHWSGDASGTDDDTTVRMDGHRTVTAHFVADTSEGSLRVNLSPPQAVAETAQWKYRNYTAWRDSGNTQGNIPVGTGYVHFKDIPGWITPDEVQATIPGGQTITVNATYREIKGAVQVTITPPQAAQAGARWRLNGGAWQESGTTLADAPTGTNTLEFLAIPGWSTAPVQTITVVRGVTTVRTGDYTPPAGFPIITSVAPRTGPITGGTTVTLEGANFLPGTTVTFGGVPATSVTVVSPTRITAVTPARASYGTVALTLTSGSQMATQANGFSYLNPLGSNIELVGQIGGSVEAVAVVGNFCYYGEGTSLVIVDFTNSAAPVERGRISLPSFIRDIAVSGTTAYVACSSSGLYAVDISSPTAPGIVGFYETAGGAYGVKIDGTSAFVATSYSGFAVLDVSNRAAIFQLGLMDTAGRVERLTVGTIGAERYAFLAEGDLALRIVRVTVPSSPVQVAVIPAQGPFGFTDVRVAGTKLYASDQVGGVRIFDVSNPASPIQTSSPAGAGSIEVVGNRLYSCDGFLKIWDLSVTPNPTRLGTFDIGSSCYDLAIANNLAFVAGGTSGLRVFAVDIPASITLRSTIDVLGSPQEVVVSGSVAFVGNGSGLHTIDVTNPARPTRLASLTGGGVTSLVVADGKATLVRYGNTTVRIANVANPSTLSQLGTYTAVEGRNVALLGNVPVLAAVTKDTAHLPMLDVLNLSTPAAPQRTGSCTLSTTAGSTDCIAVSGTWAFVGRSSQAFEVVSLANPTSPLKVGSVAIPSSSLDVAVSQDGNFVYIADGAGLRIVNTTNKNAPTLGQTIDPPQNAMVGFRAVRVVGNRLFADEFGFIYVFDISTPASPQIIAYYDTPGQGGAIDVSGDLIYVADGPGGVSILRLLDTDKPTVTITTPTTNTAYPTTSALLTLGGTATDLQGVVRVTWENDRGGGGVAQGTNAWTIPNLQLAAGVNVLTVTAEDAQGNLARDSLTVTATLPETSGPALLITGPQPPPAFTFPAATLPLTGTAADVSGVLSVAWANDRGGSGPATGTTAWSASIPLLDGPNRITLTAQDTVGNVSQTELLVTYLPPDTTAPTVGITFPTEAQEATTTDAMANLSGEADDNRAVSRVAWTNSRGGSGEATGGRAWFVNDIALQPGLNVITVTVTDSTGNEESDALALTYSPPAPPLPLRLTGAGHIIGDAAEGAVLNIGQTYTLRAVPGAGEIFGGWSGSIVSENAQLTFTAEEGMEIVANFIASPFPAVKGGYVGLVETEPFVRGMSGSAAVQVTGAGSFTAVLRFGAETVRFAGAFDGGGRFTGQVVRANRTRLQLVLALELTDGSEGLTGLISDGATTAAINADPVLSPAPQRGRYTAVLERDAASPTLPAGFGWGTLRVGTGGDVRFAGRLGDGDAVTLGGQLTKSAQWPVYATLNGGGGALIGRVNFRDIPQTSDLDGRLHWLRPNGSEGDVSLTGSAYARPASGRRILDLAGGRRNAQITFSDGLLANPVSRSLKITTSHQVSPAYPGIFTMTLDAGVGTFSGKIKFGGIGKVKFDGVLLPKIGAGKGQVRFSDGTGDMELEALP